MRKIAIGAALSGALLASALGLSAAQADTGATFQRNSVELPSGWERGGDSKASATTFGAADSVIESVTVNGGKAIPVGTTGVKSAPFSVTVSDPDGVAGALAYIWKGGSSLDTSTQSFGPELNAPVCTALSATRMTCTGTIDIFTQDELGYYLTNALAGTWNVGVAVVDNAGNETWNDFAKTAKVLRTSKLTVNASPEPVYKGKPITITGTLTRASWDDFRYHGYGSQSVRVEFRKAGTTNYTSVKGIYSAGTGGLKTAVTASIDGYWRFNYLGSPTTALKITTGDYVDVR